MRRLAAAHDHGSDVELLARHGAGARDEDRADLEEPDVALFVRQIVLGSTGEGVQNAPPEIRLVLGERVRNANEALGCATDERHRSRLEEAGADERITNSSCEQPHWIIRNVAGPERSNFDWNAIVAAQSSDFLD